METTLVVVKPFAGLSRGDVITDPRKSEEILASENANAVVRVLVTPAAAPASKQGG